MVDGLATFVSDTLSFDDLVSNPAMSTFYYLWPLPFTLFPSSIYRDLDNSITDYDNKLILIIM